MTRPKIVICGNYLEFLNWCRQTKTSPRHAVYADSNERIMGREIAESDIVKTGQYWLSKVDEIYLRSRIIDTKS